MESMRLSWTDARLNDFAAHTDQRFEALERRVDDGFRRVDADLRALNGRFDALQRTQRVLLSRARARRSPRGD